MKYVVLFLVLILPINFVNAFGLSDRLSGRILLQVEDKGEAWYVNPENKKRHYLGRPSDAFLIMRDLGLGISDKDFDSFKDSAPAQLAGKILLKVEDKGEAYYVNPLDLKMHYLGRPADAFELMRKLGLGITDKDLNQIELSQDNGSVQTNINGDEKTVTKVIDGDTVVISGGDHVRLIGIDTDEKNFPCFTPAKNYLENLILGKTVVLESDVEDKDQYNRLLRYVFFNGKNINLKLIEDGLAVCRYYAPNGKYKAECAKIEETAINSKTGCKWSGEDWKSSEAFSLIETVSSTTNEGCLIKGNINSDKEKIYHTPGCGSYSATRIDENNGERWFCSENEAIGAGWRKASNCN